MPMDANRRRRWLGAGCLALAAGMTAVGTTTLAPKLTGWWFVLYWIACLGLVILAVAVALLDWWILRWHRRVEEERLRREILAITGQCQPSNGTSANVRTEADPSSALEKPQAPRVDHRSGN